MPQRLIGWTYTTPLRPSKVPLPRMTVFQLPSCNTACGWQPLLAQLDVNKSFKELPGLFGSATRLLRCPGDGPISYCLKSIGHCRFAWEGRAKGPRHGFGTMDLLGKIC